MRRFGAHWIIPMPYSIIRLRRASIQLSYTAIGQLSPAVIVAASSLLLRLEQPALSYRNWSSAVATHDAYKLRHVTNLSIHTSRTLSRQQFWL